MDLFSNDFSSKLRLFSKEGEISKFRIYFIFFVFIGLFSILGVRLFFLTIVPNLTSKTREALNITIPFDVKSRRDIVDRNGELLATNIETASVYANPKIISNPSEAAKKLKTIFPSIDFKELLTKLKSPKSFVWIKRFITPTEHQQINDIGIPGVYFESGERRAYPYAELLSHAIGTVGLDGHGSSGIERAFDNELQYKKSGFKEAPLVLSLDVRVQNIIREELKAAIVEFGAKGGVGIVQDPNNGEVVSVVSLPDFDPYNLSKVKDEALFNKATLGSYELGSVFKPFTIASALDAGKIKLSDVYDVNDPIYLSRYQIKDFYKKDAWLSVPEILMYSSNIGVSQIALELGKKRQYGYLKSFGFLSPIDIEISEKSKPSYPPFARWSELNTITISYGHGISVSPLHITNAMSATINGGKLYPATILKVQKPGKYTQILKKPTSDTMQKLLRLVVQHGAGKRAEVDGYFVGGKTGTSNKVIDGKYSRDLRISSFVGAFPIHDPKYVIYVMLDEPKGTKATSGYATGGWTAAPAVSKIIKRIAMLYNIPPQISDKAKIDSYLHVDYNFRKRVS